MSKRTNEAPKIQELNLTETAKREFRDMPGYQGADTSISCAARWAGDADIFAFAEAVKDELGPFVVSRYVRHLDNKPGVDHGGVTLPAAVVFDD